MNDRYIRIQRLLTSCLTVLILASFQGEQENLFPPVKNDSFQRGEKIEFKLTYGIFTIGKGSARISPALYTMNDRFCYKVDVIGKTVGMVDWVADVDDVFESYIDTVSLIPHQFHRKVREGKYKLDEWTKFNHAAKKITVTTLNHKTGKMRDPKIYEAPAHVRDMISGFLILRTMDLSKTKVNDTIKIAGFFEDKFYKLNVLYKGKETIRTKVGKIRAIVIKPVMPDNKLFDGENSITAWFSDDKNRIPLRIDANMFIGTAGVEITASSGLKNPLNIVK